MFVLSRKQLKEYYIEKAYEWAKKQNYENLCGEWIENFL